MIGQKNSISYYGLQTTEDEFKMDKQEWGFLSSIKKFVDEHSDKRTKDWPFIENPSMLLVLSAAYLYFVYFYGPSYMKSKKPYNLKNVLTVYNIGQIISCAYLIYGFLTSGWLDNYSLGCQPVDKSLNPKAVRMAELVWWTMLLKLVEFAETIFFVLRKKDRQISGLHVYHHITTLFLGWVCCRFVPGGMLTFPIIVNCVVHIFMYSYYLIALHAGRELQSKLKFWKKTITLIQMMQFIILMLHSLNGFRSDCNVPNFVFYLFLPDLIVLYYMFYEFYKSTYKYIRKHK